MRESVLYRCGRLPKTANDTFQLLLPEFLKEEVLKRLHDDHEHQGVERTLQLVREVCFWPNIWRDVENYCHHCNCCLIAKANQPRVRTFPTNIVAPQPFEMVAVDFLILEKAADCREIGHYRYVFKPSQPVQLQTF